MKKRIISMLLAATMLMTTIVGCGQVGTEKDNKREQTATGRYMEEEVTLPENATYADAMVHLENGTFRVAVTDKENRTSVWDLKGDTWEQVYAMPEEWFGKINFTLYSEWNGYDDRGKSSVFRQRIKCTQRLGNE